MKDRELKLRLKRLGEVGWRKRVYCLVLTCLVTSSFLPWNAYSYMADTSSTSKSRNGWLNGGLGVSRFGNSGGLSLGISFSYQIERNLFSIRKISNEELCIPILGFCGPLQSVWDVGALYGIINKESIGFVSLSGGVSFVGGTHEEFYTVGIPIEAQLFWTPLSFLGIGIYGFANLNPKRSFVGGLLCLQIGKLR